MSAKLTNNYSDPEKAKEDFCAFIDENFDRIKSGRWMFPDLSVRIILEMK